MSTRGSVSDLLFGHTRAAVLGLLYGHADESFYTRQIARETHISAGALQRELENLSKVGLILRNALGSQVFYKANRQAPIFHEMRALVGKTVGVFHELESALRPLTREIGVAFVYGSVAREEETAQSDIDLMVIGEASLDDVLSALTPAERHLGRTINATVYSLQEFQAKLASGNHFLTAVLNGPKVFIVGDENELAAMGRVRLAQARTHQPQRDSGSVEHRRAQSRRLQGRRRLHRSSLHRGV